MSSFDFSFTKRALDRILNELSSELDKQYDSIILGTGTLQKNSITGILGKIDKFIIANTNVSEQMISGEIGARTAIKNEIARVQAEAKRMIEGLMQNIEKDEDKDTLKNVIKDNVDGLESVKKQAELDKLEGLEFTQKDDRTRYQEYETRIKELNTRIAKAKEYKNNVGTATKDDMEDDYEKLDEALGKYQEQIKRAENLPKGADIKKRYQYFAGAPSTRADEQNRKELKTLLDSLESLKGNNPDIATLLKDLKGQIELTDDKKGIKSIKSLSQIRRILKQPKYAKLDWEKITGDATKTKRDNAVKDLKAVMENSILLKLDPDKRKEFLDRIAGLDLSKPDIHAELDKLATDVGMHIDEGIKDIEQTAEDAAKIEDLREERADLRDAKSGLEGRNLDVKAEKVESTKKITIYGKEFKDLKVIKKVPGSDNKEIPIDFVELFSKEHPSPEDEKIMEAAINQIVNTIVPKTDGKYVFPEALNDAYKRDGDKPEKSGLRAWWHKIKTGETPEETAKRAFLKKQIRDKITELIGKDAAYKSSTGNCGELTPEELEAFRKAEREEIVRHNQSAKAAHKKTQRAVDKAQEDKDIG